jgi:hypothetical protein
MRTFLLAVVAVSSLATPAGAATRNFGITSFEKIRVDGPYSVRLTTGIAPFASASGSAAALDRVAIEMLGNTLVVRANSSSWGSGSDGDHGPVEINLGTHDLTQAFLNGSGSLMINRVKGLTFGLAVQGSAIGEIGQADVDQLSVNLIGSSNAKLAGRAAKLTAVVRGISSLDAANLATKDATLGAEGTATIGANVSNSVTVDASGPATVRLSGKPSCTLKVRGSASVSGCR